MIEGSGAGPVSVPVPRNNGSGSWRPKTYGSGSGSATLFLGKKFKIVDYFGYFCMMNLFVVFTGKNHEKALRPVLVGYCKKNMLPVPQRVGTKVKLEVINADFYIILIFVKVDFLPISAGMKFSL
jgi:hypothetical protein